MLMKFSHIILRIGVLKWLYIYMLIIINVVFYHNSIVFVNKDKGIIGLIIWYQVQRYYTSADLSCLVCADKITQPTFII